MDIQFQPMYVIYINFIFKTNLIWIQTYIKLKLKLKFQKLYKMFNIKKIIIYINKAVYRTDCKLLSLSLKIRIWLQENNLLI